MSINIKYISITSTLSSRTYSPLFWFPGISKVSSFPKANTIRKKIPEREPTPDSPSKEPGSCLPTRGRTTLIYNLIQINLSIIKIASKISMSMSRYLITIPILILIPSLQINNISNWVKTIIIIATYSKIITSLRWQNPKIIMVTNNRLRSLICLCLDSRM